MTIDHKQPAVDHKQPAVDHKHPTRATCGAVRDTLVCDREVGHVGDHRGYLAQVDEVLFWPNTNHTVDVMSVALAIAEHSKGNAGDGTMPCPVCRDGTLRYAIAGRPGRRAVSAWCSTTGCVAFMS